MAFIRISFCYHSLSKQCYKNGGWGSQKTMYNGLTTMMTEWMGGAKHGLWLGQEWKKMDGGAQEEYKVQA